MMTIALRIRFISLLITSFFASNTFGQEAGIGSGIVKNNYIGGFYNCDVKQYPVFNDVTPTISFRVKTADDLLKKLETSKPGTVIYLEDNVVFDLTGKSKIKIPRGVSLISGRGKNKSTGALVMTRALDTYPLFRTAGENILISGIRFEGPDGNVINPKSPKGNISYGLPNSSFLHVYHKNLIVINCEIFNWSQSGIFIRNAGNAEIAFNYIHHNQRQGLGYGVTIDGGYGNIYANIFDYNRHAIAGTGIKGTAYTAKYNIALPHSTEQGHVFDMHGGSDRKDGTNMAGDSIVISNNLIYVKNKPAVMVRGVSNFNSSVKNNVIVNVSSNTDQFDVPLARSTNSLIKSVVKFFNTNSKDARNVKAENQEVNSYVVQKNAHGNLERNNNLIENQ